MTWLLPSAGYVHTRSAQPHAYSQTWPTDPSSYNTAGDGCCGSQPHRAASGELWSWASSSDRQTLRDCNVPHNHALDAELSFRSCRPCGPQARTTPNTSTASVEKPRSTGTRHPRVRAKAEPYFRAPALTPRALESVPDYRPRFNTAGQNTTVNHNYPRCRRSGLFGGLPWQQD